MSATEERSIPSFVGAESVVGACLGTAAWTVPYFVGGALWWLLLLPASGVVLLALPVTALRRLGVGLVGSALVWPATALAVLVLATVGDLGLD